MQIPRDVTAIVLIVTAMLNLSVCIPLHEGSKSDWDLLVYAQQWAPTFCQLNKHRKCEVPRVVGTDTWSIHGLWPSKMNGSPPTGCNNSSPLDVRQIEGLRDKLVRFWPNLFPDTNIKKLWEHEWKKHGTCGVNLEAIDTQYKYFSVGLILSRDLNIYNALAMHDILPSSQQTYTYNDIVNALKDTFDIESPPMMACYNDEKNNLNYLLQIYFCLSKDFELLSCEDTTSYHPKHSCEPDVPILIPPIVFL